MAADIGAAWTHGAGLGGEGLETLCSLFKFYSHIKVMGPIFLPINLSSICKPFWWFKKE